MSRRAECWIPFIAAAGWLLVGSACSGPTRGASEPKPASSAPGTPAKGIATFAGGCFWCMEPPFEALDGVQSVVSGYTGGGERNPSYRQVSSGGTGHAEAIQIRYDPERVDYATLLDVFWRQIDPRDAGGQFADRGTQYRTGIFVHDEEQRRLAERSKLELERSGRFDAPVVTAIVPAVAFYPAEEYHQDYYKKNPSHYKSYRRGSGRQGFLERTWGSEPQKRAVAPTTSATRPSFVKPSEAELRKRLTALQYRVTQEEGTERPFANEYWDNKRAGIYVDIVSGEPLFSSLDKYRSGTGWPSFTRALAPENIVTREDRHLMQSRIELRSKKADSHLGHVFPDGPKPTGQRYCINSASLRFVPKEKLKDEGYAQFASLFE